MISLQNKVKTQMPTSTLNIQEEPRKSEMMISRNTDTSQIASETHGPNIKFNQTKLQEISEYNSKPKATNAQKDSIVGSEVISQKSKVITSQLSSIDLQTSVFSSEENSVDKEADSPSKLIVPGLQRTAPQNKQSTMTAKYSN